MSQLYLVVMLVALGSCIRRGSRGGLDVTENIAYLKGHRLDVTAQLCVFFFFFFTHSYSTCRVKVSRAPTCSLRHEPNAAVSETLL